MIPRFIKLTLLLVGVLWFTSVLIVAQSFPDDLTIVWIDDGQLFAQTGNATSERWLENIEDISRVAVAPVDAASDDGIIIAYTRADNATLWIAVPGEAARQIDVPEYVDRFAWVDAHTLAVNTASPATEEAAFGRAPRKDLYFYNLIDDTLNQFDIAGDFIPGPSGVVIVHAGNYAQQDARLIWLDETGQQTELLAYPAVSTGSHYPFYPQIFWEADGEAFRVAIPHPDAIYDATGTSPVQLWHVTLVGKKTLLGEIPAGFFVQPRWSPDGSHLLYVQLDGAAGQARLFVADAAGQEAQVYATGDIVDQSPPVWLDGERFLYLHDGAYWLGQVDQEPQRWRAISSYGVLPPLSFADGVLLREFNDKAELTLSYAGPGEDDEAVIATSASLSPYVEVFQEGTP